MSNYLFIHLTGFAVKLEGNAMQLIRDTFLYRKEIIEPSVSHWYQSAN